LNIALRADDILCVCSLLLLDLSSSGAATPLPSIIAATAEIRPAGFFQSTAALNRLRYA